MTAVRFQNDGPKGPDKADVEALANGRWAQVYSALASSPETDWDLIDSSPKKYTGCPVHQSREKNPQNFRAGHGWDRCGMVICGSCGPMNYVQVLQRLNSWTFPEILQNIWDELSGASTHVRPQPAPRPVAEQKPEVDVSMARAAAARMLEESVPLDHPDAEPVRLYLANRKIGPVYGPLEDVRCVPSARYPMQPFTSHPVMLVVLRLPTGERINLHQTWLTRDGHKAELPKKKLIFPRLETGPWIPTAHFDPIGEIMCFGEGMEDGLSVRALTDLPTWGIYAAGVFDALELPDVVRVVLVFAQYDPERDNEKGIDVGATGFKHASIFARRFANERRIVHVVMPTPPADKADGTYDWTNYLHDNGPKAMRFVQTYVRQAQRDLEKLKKDDAARARADAEAAAAKATAVDAEPTRCEGNALSTLASTPDTSDDDDGYPFD